MAQQCLLGLCPFLCKRRGYSASCGEILGGVHSSGAFFHHLHGWQWVRDCLSRAVLCFLIFPALFSVHGAFVKDSHCFRNRHAVLESWAPPRPYWRALCGASLKYVNMTQFFCAERQPASWDECKGFWGLSDSLSAWETRLLEREREREEREVGGEDWRKMYGGRRLRASHFSSLKETPGVDRTILLFSVLGSPELILI